MERWAWGPALMVVGGSCLFAGLVTLWTYYVATHVEQPLVAGVISVAPVMATSRPDERRRAKRRGRAEEVAREYRERIIDECIAAVKSGTMRSCRVPW